MSGRTILIVEDSGIIAREIRQIVERMGHRVCGIAVTGRDAIAQADAHQPDLVLMDIVLEDGMSGIDAARAIRSKRDVPVIYITADADEETLDKALRAEPYAYLVKPFKEQDLRASIEVSLYKSRMERLIQKTGQLRSNLLVEGDLDHKLALVTDGVVDIFGADFARIWVVQKGDLCDKGCLHAAATEGLNVCRDRSRCLHLVASSGRYARVDGEHARVPLGCYKIGRVASGDEPKFITNDVANDPRVHDTEWARSLGLVSFAGYNLMVKDRAPNGVLALFSQRPISPADDTMLEDIASSTSQVLQAEIATAALQESEQKHRDLLQSIALPVLALRHDLSIFYCNRAYAEFVGMDCDQLIGKRLLDLFPDYEGTQSFQAYRECLATGAIGEVEGPMGDRFLYARIYPTANGLLAVCEDVTARRQSAAGLRESEERYRALFDRSTDSLFLVDFSGNFLDVNATTVQQTGYARDELLAMNLLSIVGEDDRAYLRGAIESIAATGMSRGRREYIIKTKDGRQLRMDGEGTLVYHDGKPYAVLCVARDMTAQRLTEAALRQGEEKFNKAFANSPVGMAIIAQKDNRFVDVNQTFLQTFEYQDEDVIGMTTAEIGFYADNSQHAFILQMVREKGQIVNFETTAKTKTGKLRRLALSGQTVELHGGTLLLALSKDLTERTPTEEDLRESEERFRQLAENINQVYWLTDWESKKLLYVNPNFEKLYGQTCVSAYENRLNWIESLHPDDRAWVSRLFLSYAEQGRYVEAEYRIIKKDDGTVRWVYDRSVPIRDEQGNVYRYASVAEDITVRKQAEIALRESEERYKTMFTDTLEGMSIVRDGRLIDVNKAWLELHGYREKEQVLGRDVMEFIHHDYHGMLQERRATVFPNNVERIYQSRDMRQDGSSVYVEIKSSTIRLNGTEVILAAVRDITTRIQAERALQSRQQALQAIYEIETTPGESFDDVCQRVCWTMIQLINVAGAAIERYHYDEYRTICRIDVDGSQGTAQGAVNGTPRSELLRSKQAVVYAGDVRARFPDDKQFHENPAVQLYAGVPIVNAGGSVVGGISVFDVREKVLNEDDLHLMEIFARYLGFEIDRQQAEDKLRESDKVKLLSNVAAGVAHEVRNPLHAILAIVEALFLELGDNDAYKEYLAHIQAQVQRLSHLMNDLLELGKPLQQANLKQENAVDLCYQAISLWCDSYPNLNRVISVQSEPDTAPCLVRADGAKIQQVMINLLDNAYQHSPEHSEIIIKVEEAPPGGVRISVIDQGAGVPEGNLPRLFEPFFTTKRKGTGLGLSLCKHIVENHGGSIRVSNNTLAAGCTVEITLPHDSQVTHEPENPADR